MLCITVILCSEDKILMIRVMNLNIPYLNHFFRIIILSKLSVLYSGVDIQTLNVRGKKIMTKDFFKFSVLIIYLVYK